MSIIKAIEKAYSKALQRNFDRLYFAIDLHGVVLKENYQNGKYEFFNDDVVPALKKLQELRPEFKIAIWTIVWSSILDDERQKLDQFFVDNGIYFDFYNENPKEISTSYADFSKKFYFSVLLDDKAGFDPDTDWKLISEWCDNNR